MYSNGRDDDSVSRGKSDQFSALALTYIGESFKFAVIPTYIDSDSLKTATTKVGASFPRRSTATT